MDSYLLYQRKGEPSLIGASTLGWGLPYDSSVMIEDYDGRKVPYSPIKNNMLDMYQLGFNTNTNVSVRGGNEKHHSIVLFLTRK